MSDIIGSEMQDSEIQDWKLMDDDFTNFFKHSISHQTANVTGQNTTTEVAFRCGFIHGWMSACSLFPPPLNVTKNGVEGIW